MRCLTMFSPQSTVSYTFLINWYSDTKIELKSNDALRLASTFYTMHSISSQISPDPTEEDDYLAGSHLHDGIKTIGKYIFYSTFTEARYHYNKVKVTNYEV